MWFNSPPWALAPISALAPIKGGGSLCYVHHVRNPPYTKVRLAVQTSLLDEPHFFTHIILAVDKCCGADDLSDEHLI